MQLIQQKACKQQFVWGSISLFTLALDSELTLALMIIIRLTSYSLSPREPTITIQAHCVRTQSVWGASHWIIPGYLHQTLLTNMCHTHTLDRKINTQTPHNTRGRHKRIISHICREPDVDFRLIFLSRKRC